MSQRLRVDTLLCLLTGTLNLMDGHYMGKFDADSCGYDFSFEAGWFLIDLVTNAH